MSFHPRHPAAFTFLKWAGPSVLAGLATIAGLAIGASEAWPRAGDWIEAQFLDWYPLVSSGWFFALLAVLILGYLAALLYAGTPKRATGYSLDNIDGLARALGVAPDSSGTEWEPLHKALRYIALESDWAFQVTEQDVRALDNLLEAQIIEHLARGDLSARGVEYEGNNERTRSTVYIPSEFWETAFIQSFAEIVLIDDNRCAAARDGRHTHVARRSYRRIIVDKGAVRQIWPPRNNRKEGEKSIFHFALIAYFKNDGDHQRLARQMRLLVASYDKFQ